MSKLFKSCSPLRYKISQIKQFSTSRTRRFINKPLAQIFCGAATVGAISGLAYAIQKKSETPIRNENGDLRNKFNFINKIVEKCAAGVVYVEIKNPRKNDKNIDNGSVVSNGSGFIISEDGWILTNAHVVINKPSAVIEISLHDGSVYTATVIEADMNVDLALIKIEPTKKLTPLNLAKNGDVSVGEWVVALGSPLSLSHSATAGVVSSINRGADELGLRNHQMRYIQTDAPITFGNSGGPLVNLDGDVIGINNLRITAGISFAIPIEYVSQFLDRIKMSSSQPTKVKPEFQLGITSLMVTPEIQDLVEKHQNSEIKINKGVFIWKLIPHSFMEQVGFRVGDVITHVDGREMTTSQDLYKNINSSSKSFLVDVVRDGKRIKVGIQPQK